MCAIFYNDFANNTYIIREHGKPHAALSVPPVRYLLYISKESF